MNPIAKGLIALGVLLIILGLFWEFGGKSLPLGRLPGDISIERENFKFYLPMTSSILISLLLSLIGYFIRWMNKS